ncbi:MAG: DUF2202 domain-containing protein [Phycisphaerales bacterium]|nr:DUF2202 domain-containing protein [Phycisphaerales bacterium]
MPKQAFIQAGLVGVALFSSGAMVAAGPRVTRDARGLGVARLSAVSGPERPVVMASPELASWLLHMREEEKIARDVYRTLGQLWGVNVFSNITSSEQNHMNSMASMLDRYGLPDPVVDDSTGVFTNPAFAELYTLLVERGSESLMEGYKVGAKIEELDIVDLREAIVGAQDPVLISVYENLLRGSRNHLRAFARQIYNNGGTYEAEHLTQEEFDEIANSDFEPGGN